MSVTFTLLLNYALINRPLAGEAVDLEKMVKITDKLAEIHGSNRSEFEYQSGQEFPIWQHNDSDITAPQKSNLPAAITDLQKQMSTLAATVMQLANDRGQHSKGGTPPT